MNCCNRRDVEICKSYQLRADVGTLELCMTGFIYIQVCAGWLCVSGCSFIMSTPRISRQFVSLQQSFRCMDLLHTSLSVVWYRLMLQ